jgi:hypothetical protein
MLELNRNNLPQMEIQPRILSERWHILVVISGEIRCGMLLLVAGYANCDFNALR